MQMDTYSTEHEQNKTVMTDACCNSAISAVISHTVEQDLGPERNRAGMGKEPR